MVRFVASSTDGEISGQMCLGPSGEDGDLLVPHLLVPHMEPLNLSAMADGVLEPIKAVPRCRRCV
jgi:hypothetical protein